MKSSVTKEFCKRFAFTWDSADEVDEASGSGWLQLSSKDEVEGLFKINGGDRITVAFLK